jgi:hypothetical protein
LELDDAVRSVADLWGADFWGVADLAPARGFVFDQGGDAAVGYPHAVSAGIALSDAIVDQLSRRGDWSVMVSYQHQYRTVNQRLDLVASQMASVLLSWAPCC